MSDQSVREIQLNGKQLVFMFMTATVAAVVIFLCGVMVGRGVNTTHVPGAAAVAADATVDPTSTPSSVPAADASATGEPASTQDDLKELTYPNRLGAAEQPPEPAVEPAAVPVPAVADVKTERAPVVATAVRPTPTPAARPTATVKIDPKGEPKGDGFVVQVASFRSRSEADKIAKRLSSKGYRAFVSTSGPHVFRVRVGKFAERREADSVATRLKQEEQFKPWITQ